MKSNSFLNRFLNNWPVKSICLIAAAFLYAVNYLNTQESLILEVPLKVILPEKYALAASPPATVKLTIKGSQDTGIQELNVSDFTAYAELPENKVEPGLVKVSVTYEKLGNALAITPLAVTVQPPVILIKIEEKIQKSVKVLPNTTGSPPEGYEVSDSYWRPESVIIAGAGSRVRQIEHITGEEISFSGRTKNFFVSVPLICKDPLIEIRDATNLDFSAYLTEMMTEIQYPGVEIRCLQINPRLELARQLPRGAITIKASSQFLNSLNTSSLHLSINCANIVQPGKYTLKTTPEIPVNSTLISHTPREVVVDLILRR